MLSYLGNNDYLCILKYKNKPIKGYNMDLLHVIAVIVLVAIGGYIYWNKRHG